MNQCRAGTDGTLADDTGQGDDPTMSGDQEPISDLPTRLPNVDAGATSVNPVAQAVTSGPSSGGTGSSDAETSQSASQIGRQYGPYKIVAELGSGGMGAVFLADQKEPVHRQVALQRSAPRLRR